MVEFICMTCGKTIKKDEMGRRTRCPYCGGKIILKKRPKIVKTVKAI
ncbi:DNA-directed RNA polymerase subunit P [Nanoarchaeota archaeon]|nr:MAG: DNA-directed RNA polymerase subunit P [Nanoarchaeota archaeon]